MAAEKDLLGREIPENTIPTSQVPSLEQVGDQDSEVITRMVLRALRKDKVALVGLIIIVIVTVTAIFANNISPSNPLAPSLPNLLKWPSVKHLLGTDELGRDLLSRIIYGSRVSLLVGASVVSTALIIGIFLGAVSGYYGGKVDLIVMRFVDTFLAFPGIILAVAVVAVVGPGVQNVIIALILINWPSYTRVMRGEVLRAKQNEFVVASRGMGASDFWIMRKHLIPNAISPLIVLGTIGFGYAILAEAGLSFLGLGVQPPTPSWGGMVSEGLTYILNAPYISIFAGLAIALTVLSFNMLGDGLRDALDPSLRI
jgi:peptide/nickel transport system permease protein